MSHGKALENKDITFSFCYFIPWNEYYIFLYVALFAYFFNR